MKSFPIGGAIAYIICIAPNTLTISGIILLCALESKRREKD
jgi:hypothetical protein